MTAPSGYYASSASKTIPNCSTPQFSAAAVNNDGTVVVDFDIATGGYIASTSTTVNGGTVAVQAAQTIHPSTSDQTISADKYLTGTQTVKGVLLTNLTAGNIKKDVVVKVGDSTDDDCVTSVTGAYEGGGGTQYPYILGGYYKGSAWTAETLYNHVTISATGSNISSSGIGLRNFTNLSCPTWFTINAGDSYEIKITNVVNTSGANWAVNAKRANSTTSLSYGTGNGTHISGETISGTQVSTENIGCFFVYITSMSNGNTLEFDIEVKINGTRIL